MYAHELVAQSKNEHNQKTLSSEQTDVSANAPKSYTSTLQIRNLKENPSYVYIENSNYNGVFRYDPKDKTTPDNNGTVLVTKGGKRYKRVLEGPINAQQHFAAKGDGRTDDTKALQAAIDAACKANNPKAKGTSSPSEGSNTVYIPHGFYKITGELFVRGSCTIMMEQASSYGGTRIQQTAQGKHLFHIIKDNDGISSGVHIIGGILKGGATKAGNETALIYGGESAQDANNNSTYIDNVWFQTPEKYGVNLARGDDIHIRNCTFDVSAYHSVKLGSRTNVVTNSSIIGCTFYDIRGGAIDLINVEVLQINNNIIYANKEKYIPYFINANGESIKGVQISNNLIQYVNRLIFMNQNSEDIQITNNMHRYGSGRSIELGGGQTLHTIYIVSNVFTGDFSGNVNLEETVPNSPIFCYSTGLINSSIVNNTFRHIGKEKAVTPILLTDKRVINNLVTNNMIIGFSDKGQIANIKLNKFD
jgi:hypothetical protein